MRTAVYLVLTSAVMIVSLYLVNEFDDLKYQNKMLEEDVAFLGTDVAFLKTQISFLETELEKSTTLLKNICETYETASLREGTVLTPSGFTPAMLEAAWASLGATGLQGTGATFIEIEKKHGVNALFLAAVAYLESGGGASPIARDKNNLLGLGAHDIDPYNYAMSFDCKNESIVYAAELLERNYLSRGGKYYSGDDAYGIGVNYATDPLWPVKVYGTMKLIANHAFDVSLIESITETPWKQYLKKRALF